MTLRALTTPARPQLRPLTRLALGERRSAQFVEKQKRAPIGSELLARLFVLMRLELASGSEAERAVAQRLTDLVERYSLARWSFTDRVVIAQGATPHSHPVLTLGTDYPHDSALVSSYVHEQLHWWSITSAGASGGRDRRVFEMLRSRYATLPTEPPEGCGGEFSNLVHLHVCWLELEVLAQLFGWEWAKERAQRVPFYRSIYRTVAEDFAELRRLFVSAGMGLPERKTHGDEHHSPPY